MTRRYRSRRYLSTLAVATALTTASTAPATAGPAGTTALGDRSWRPDLSIVDQDDSGVISTGQGEGRGHTVSLARTAPSAASTRNALRTGFLTLAPHRLDTPADTIAATATTSIPNGTEVAVDVRGALGDDRWTEWVEARPGVPAVLPAAVDTVQVRLALTSTGPQTPEVGDLTLTPSTTRSSPAEAAELTYRVYATREGLVGGTTANGHVITDRDHFAALPSRRGLSANDDGTYTVRVCAANGRCEWAPVWDVGPWNTKDDYWNPADTREMWQDLPQGKPQAQAAREDGYNGGKDQFGREVANPAGVDLADGTFWDGLGLTENAWVTVTYLWTGAGPEGVVRTEKDPLNVRSGATSSAAQVGLAAKHARVRVECQLVGEPVSGTQGTSDIWYRIATDMYVAKAYVSEVPDAPVC
ncbi:hypothetical protein FHS29_001323 [Saccharothrix tamanrassetensis]|uniref:Secreted protein n=1 Tax=Saccharothrix tamanrassetensis TaxID=1051531 RepID=A0A841CCS4_9PSEU|nr:hypothetical protein [Saccharothrix tamanrassetensis]MBB5954753.1 hypothetical protein [Saccharothrix tamanrassetensis]